MAAVRVLKSLFKMEGNRDESEKCLKLARKFAASGEKEKAIKYVLKADKLYPSAKAKGKVPLIPDCLETRFFSRHLTRTDFDFDVGQKTFGVGEADVALLESLFHESSFAS